MHNQAMQNAVQVCSCMQRSIVTDLNELGEAKQVNSKKEESSHPNEQSLKTMMADISSNALLVNSI